MGARIRFALVKGSDDQILEIAERCKVLLTNFDNPINYSLMYMATNAFEPYTAALGLISFRSKEVIEFARVPELISTRFKLKLEPDQTKKSFLHRLFKTKCDDSAVSIAEAWDTLLRTPALSIAAIVSDVVGTSLCGIYNDTTCSSGLIQFDAGKVITGEVYGSGGTDVLFTFSNGVAAPSIISLDSAYDYGKAIRDGFYERYGAEFNTCVFLEGLKESKRFVLMEKKEFVTPIRIESD